MSAVPKSTFVRQFNKVIKDEIERMFSLPEADRPNPRGVEH